MSRLFSPVLAFFQPNPERRFLEAKAQVQVHRLLSLLCAALISFVGIPLAAVEPEGPNLLWECFAMAGGFLGLLGASYGSSHVRRKYPVWMRGMLYLSMGGYALQSAQDGLAGNHGVGLMVVYSVLPVVVAVGARSVSPVLRFLDSASWWG